MIYIHPTAQIGPNVIFESDIYVGPFCVIGYPAEWKHKEHIDKGVYISKGTRITGMVTIDSGVEKQTFVGENCYLMKHSHIGHDCTISDNVIISCGVKVGGHTRIFKNCNIGLNAVIHQRQTIAEGCMIGMGSVITRKMIIIPYSKYAGNPAKIIGENIKK